MPAGVLYKSKKRTDATKTIAPVVKSYVDRKTAQAYDIYRRYAKLTSNLTTTINHQCLNNNSSIPLTEADDGYSIMTLQLKGIFHTGDTTNICRIIVWSLPDPSYAVGTEADFFGRINKEMFYIPDDEYVASPDYYRRITPNPFLKTGFKIWLDKTVKLDPDDLQTIWTKTIKFGKTGLRVKKALNISSINPKNTLWITFMSDSSAVPHPLITLDSIIKYRWN